MSSRTITSVVTADTIALNAAVFGYAGHSIVTPHQAIQQIWWTDERIEAKVTREFIISKLRPNEREQLNRPVFFGEGLTDDTYLDWVLRKAKRLYLILVECGVSDQIFGLVQDSWDDDDLPISLGEISSLALSYKNDGELNKKFHHTQFKFLLRPLYQHGHVDYASNEVIPVEYIHRLPPAAALQSWSRLHLPKKPNEVFMRRKLSLGEKDEIDPVQESQFLTDIDIARSLEHDHIASVWASWTTKDSGFWISSFVAEHNLKSFIDFRLAASVQKISKPQRYAILLDWLHCLADAIASLHHRGMHHGAITPSNILIDAANNIAFSDVGSLKSFQKDKKLDPNEVYTYGAPENHIASKTAAADTPISPPSRSFFGHRRKNSSTHERKGSLDSSSGSNGTGSSAESTFSVDSQAHFAYKTRSNPSSSTFTLGKIQSNETLSPPRPPAKDYLYSPISDSSWNKSSPLESIPEPPRRAPPPPPLPILKLSTPQDKYRQEIDQRPADIFSLGCVFLDILTYLFKKRITDLIKHRSTKQKNSNGKGSRVDASFHANTSKVVSWMEVLEKEATESEEPSLRAIPPLLRLIRVMLSQNPQLRPTAEAVRSRIFDALVSYGGLSVHCAGRTHDTDPNLIPPSPAPTSTSMGSIPSLASEPRIAAFPPSLPPKSPLRDTTPAMSFGSLSPTTESPLSPPPPPPRTSSRAYSSSPWGKKPVAWNGMVGVSV